MNQPIEERLLHCIDLLYESTLDVSCWPRAMKAVSDLLNGNGALYLVFSSDCTLMRLDSVDIPPEAFQLYDFLYPQDTRVQALQRLPLLEVFNDANLSDRGAFEKTDLFNLVLKPFDIPNNVFTAVAPGIAGSFGGLVIERSALVGPASRQEERLLSNLASHVARAVRIQQLFGAERSRRVLLEECMDQLPFGMVLLDDKNEVLRISQRMLEFLRRPQSNLVLHRNRLRVRDAQANADLARACGLAIQRNSLARCASTLTIPTQVERRDLIITVIPLTGREHAQPNAAALLIVRETHPEEGLSTAELTQRYALTAAESRLALALAEGLSLKEAADRFDVSVNTCKAQLKAIYRKTASRNRSDLTRTIAKLEWS